MPPNQTEAIKFKILFLFIYISYVLYNGMSADICDHSSSQDCLNKFQPYIYIYILSHSQMCLCIFNKIKILSIKVTAVIEVGGNNI